MALSTVLGAALSSPAAAASNDDETNPQCPTYASPPANQSARELTILGVNCFEAARYDWALTYYRRAYEAQADPFLLGAIGRSFHELGLYEPALDYYERFLRSEDDNSETAQRIHRRIDELQSRIDDEEATLSVQSVPAGATASVVLDNGEWVPLGQAPLEFAVAPGDYRFGFESPTRRPAEVSAKARRHQRQQVRGHLVSEDAVFNTSALQRRRAGAWTMIGSGVVSTAGITLLVLSAQSRGAARDLADNYDDAQTFDRRRQDYLDRADTLQLSGTITTALGAAGLVTGALLYWLSPRDDGAASEGKTNGDDERPAQVRRRFELTPQVGFQSLGLQLRF